MNLLNASTIILELDNKIVTVNTITNETIETPTQANEKIFKTPIYLRKAQAAYRQRKKVENIDEYKKKLSEYYQKSKEKKKLENKTPTPEQHEKQKQRIRKYQQAHKNDPEVVEYYRQKSKIYYEKHKEEIKQKNIERKNKKLIENQKQND
jgi:hypothetical protein